MECERCGSVSSNKICKACMLIEGLNRDKKKKSVPLEFEAAQNEVALKSTADGLEINVKVESKEKLVNAKGEGKNIQDHSIPDIETSVKQDGT